MSTNLIDIAILVIVLCGGIIGFRNGVFKQLVSTIGFIAVVIFSFILKTPVANFLYDKLPFFDFDGVIKGVSSLNLLIYEVIAFLIVFLLLMIIFRLLVKFTTIFEGILNATIILGIPSKILGAIVGMFQYFILAFILLYVIALPIFSVKMLKDSQFKDDILTKTPILSNFTTSTEEVAQKFIDLANKYQTINDSNEFNTEALCLFVEYKVVSNESVDRLMKKGKIMLKNINNSIDLKKHCDTLPAE